MRNLSWWTKACAVLVVCAATAIAAPAQTFNTLVNFDITNGAGPDRISLVQGTDGAFYGTTLGGGANNASNCKENLVLVPGCGTVFKITSDGTLTTLYSFCAQPNCTDGYGPFGGLVQGTDGNFYGTTEYGGTVGAGTVFKITAGGTLTTMYNFCSQQPPQCSDGEEPVGALVQGIDGNFYGTTIFGDGSGNIFKMTPQGSLTSLFSFDGKDGIGPNGGLIQATDGNFYGTTSLGGRGSGCYNQYGCGTVFRITPSGTFTSLYSFCAKSDCSTGSEPVGGLVQAADGSLFGTTAEVGEYPTGTVFKIDQNGKLTTVYEFCSQPDCADGSEPIGALIQATDGNFYGTTAGGGDITCNPGNGGGCGTVFELQFS